MNMGYFSFYLDLISFKIVSDFLLQICTYFVTYIPKYLNLFDPIVNEIVFLISFLIVHCNYLEIQLTCILTLYPATLLNLFISYNRSLLIP